MRRSWARPTPGAEASEGCGLSVSVRKGELENVERNRDKSLGITIYVGQRRGNASTSDFSLAAIEQTVQAAYDIARFTAEDPVAGLPDPQDIAGPDEQPDLDLFHPWTITSEDAARIALECEAAAFATDKRITNSEGAGVSAQQSHFFSAHSRGFRGGYASSRHSISVAPIAGKGDDMQRDAWYSSMRDARELAAPQAVGRYAAERALSRLKSRKIATRECPVLFESPLAAGLLGAFVQAVSGGSLYRKSSFLLDSLGKKVFPDHVDIVEDPLIPRGKGSAALRRRRRAHQGAQGGGRRARWRAISSAATRRASWACAPPAMRAARTTSRSRRATRSRRTTCRRCCASWARGLFVIELMGQGVNYVTGDYSRGASGFWVENGEIAYPVQEITIAGNMKDMLSGIQSVGADTYNYGAKTVGSVLINRMKVAGS